jgi:hypothetical protein
MIVLEYGLLEFHFRLLYLVDGTFNSKVVGIKPINIFEGKSTDKDGAALSCSILKE